MSVHARRIRGAICYSSVDEVCLRTEHRFTQFGTDIDMIRSETF